MMWVKFQEDRLADCGCHGNEIESESTITRFVRETSTGSLCTTGGGGVKMSDRP